MTAAAKKKTTTSHPGRPKIGRDTPVNAERVMRIVRMRDEEGLFFRDIAEILSEDYPISGQGVFATYKRWRPWVVKTLKAAERKAVKEAAAASAKKPVTKAKTRAKK